MWGTKYVYALGKEMSWDVYGMMTNISRVDRFYITDHENENGP